MIPVRGDVRLVDGKETLVFSGSQKAISWLNKIFASMHESSLPTRLQKYSRRSSSAPSRSPFSPTELASEPRIKRTADSAVPDSPSTRVRRPKSREKSPRHSPRIAHGTGMKKAKAWGSPPASPSVRDHPTSLSRQKKSFLRGKRPPTSSPRDSTISSRAKSCERVRPKSSGLLSPSSPQKRKLLSSLTKPIPKVSTAPPTAGANGMDAPYPLTPKRFSTTPHRLRSHERPSTAAASKIRDSPSTTGVREAAKAPTRARRRPILSSPDDEDSESPTPSPRQLRNELPIEERMKALSISPFCSLARMTISSTNRRRIPASTTALMRRFATPSKFVTPAKLTSIPEVLHQRPGSPIRPSSPQTMEHKRPWDYTESPISSTSPEADRSNVTTPMTPGVAFAAPVVSIGPPKSPLAGAAARPITPIASDFLRTTPDDESWRRLLSNPNKTFFKNPLFSKALERQPSTALRSLAHPGEMIRASSLKQFSSATKKFISRALTRISKVDHYHKSHLPTVICQ